LKEQESVWPMFIGLSLGTVDTPGSREKSTRGRRFTFHCLNARGGVTIINSQITTGQGAKKNVGAFGCSIEYISCIKNQFPEDYETNIRIGL